MFPAKLEKMDAKYNKVLEIKVSCTEGTRDTVK